MKATHIAGLMIVGIIGVGALYYFLPGIFSGQQQALTGQTPTNVFAPQPLQPGLQFTGDIAINVVASNSDNNTSYTDGTEYKVNYLEKTATGWNFLGQSSSGTKDIGVKPGLDVIWAEVVIQSSKAYFTDWKATVNANGGCSAGKGVVCNPDFADADRDNINMYIFPIDVTTQKANADPSLKPALTWQLKLAGDQIGTLNDATYATGVGTGSVQNTLEWQLNFDHQPGSEAITAIQIRINDTDDSKWYPLKSYILINDKQITLAEMSSYKDTSNTRTVYEKKYGTDVNSAEFISVPSVGAKNAKTSFIWTTNFASGDDMCIELEFTKVSALGAYTETTDDIEVTNDSTVSEECSISDD